MYLTNGFIRSCRMQDLIEIVFCNVYEYGIHMYDGHDNLRDGGWAPEKKDSPNTDDYVLIASFLNMLRGQMVLENGLLRNCGMHYTIEIVFCNAYECGMNMYDWHM